MFIPGLIISRDEARERPLLAESAAPLPEHIDLRAEMLPSSNQGQTPRCAAYAMAGVIEWHRWKREGVKEQVDPNPIYERAKKLDGFPNEPGTTLEAVIKAAVELRLTKLDMATISVADTAHAAKRELHRSGALLSGFSITAGWTTAKPDGWIADAGEYIGDHAVVLVGYSALENWVAVQNSWGDASYGWRGFNRMVPQQFENEFRYALVWDW